MRRTDKTKEPEESLLFDLPLAGPGALDDEEPILDQPRRAPRASRAPAPPPEPLAAQPSRSPRSPKGSRPVPVPDPEPLDDEEETSPRSEFAGRGERFAAGGADLLMHAVLLVAALLGVRALGVRPSLTVWPAFALLLLPFSFLYTVLPLAFWGHTLGMAWRGITSRNRDGEPLTFDQTVRRWLGAIVTMAALGLPLLVMGGRRSLTDVISGSASYPGEGPA
jgi:uncharacterized RDD family membrane protein YckC